MSELWKWQTGEEWLKTGECWSDEIDKTKREETKKNLAIAHNSGLPRDIETQTRISTNTRVVRPLASYY